MNETRIPKARQCEYRLISEYSQETHLVRLKSSGLHPLSTILLAAWRPVGVEREGARGRGVAR